MVTLSLVTPCFNPGPLLTELADCLARQTHTDFEWIIVDDGSDAPTLEILDAIEARDDLNATVIRCAHQGGNVCRNLGASRSSGTHIKYLDADDYMDETLLQHQFESACQHPQAIIVSPTIIVKPDGATSRLPMPPEQSDDVLGDYLYESWSCHCACLIPRTMIDKVGGWDEQLRYGQDLEFFRRLLMRLDPIVVRDDRSAYYYRHHDQTNRLSTAKKDVSGKYRAQMQALDDFAAQLESAGRLSDKYRALIARNYDRWACSAVLLDAATARLFVERAREISGGQYPVYGGGLFRALRKVFGLSLATRLVRSGLLQNLHGKLSGVLSRQPGRA